MKCWWGAGAAWGTAEAGDGAGWGPEAAEVPEGSAAGAVLLVEAAGAVEAGVVVSVCSDIKAKRKEAEPLVESGAGGNGVLGNGKGRGRREAAAVERQDCGKRDGDTTGGKAPMRRGHWERWRPRRLA
jgi:hypothetical protein